MCSVKPWNIAVKHKCWIENGSVEVVCTYPLAESSTVENGKLNGHATGGPAEAAVDPNADGAKRAFLSLEQDEKGQAKASVLEVFKKVNPLVCC